MSQFRGRCWHLTEEARDAAGERLTAHRTAPAPAPWRITWPAVFVVPRLRTLALYQVRRVKGTGGRETEVKKGEGLQSRSEVTRYSSVKCSPAFSL